MIGKSALLNAIAGTNRGLLANPVQKQAILAAIAQLEDRNPTPQPLSSSRLEGDWRLLYTTSTGILGIDRFPFFNLGQVYQCIRTASAQLYNIAEILGPPYLEGIVSIAASFTPSSERRVQVRFERSIVGSQRLLRYQSPAQFIRDIAAGQKFTAVDVQIDPQREQRGWLDITYLDDDLRIGRGNEGSVFVLTRG
jgi:PAP_fibrillin